VSTTKALYSVRRLLAFACILLSLAVAGIGEVARAVDYGSDGGLFLALGLIGALASTLWFLFVLISTPPTEDDGSANQTMSNTDGTDGATAPTETDDADEPTDADESTAQTTTLRGPF
jgi:hypothetical protein